MKKNGMQAVTTNAFQVRVVFLLIAKCLEVQVSHKCFPEANQSQGADGASDACHISSHENRR